MLLKLTFRRSLMEFIKIKKALWELPTKLIMEGGLPNLDILPNCAELNKITIGFHLPAPVLRRFAAQRVFHAQHIVPCNIALSNERVK